MRTRPSFETLEVYRVAEELADCAWEMVSSWGNLAKDTVGKQLIRAADSIGANIAEGCGRGTYRDNKHYVDVARGSLNETAHWLRRAYRRKLIPQSRTKHLQALMDRLAPMLNAYRRSLCNRMRTAQTSERPPRKTTSDRR